MAAPARKLAIRLSTAQRAALEQLVHTDTRSAHARRRAAIRLQADAAGPDRGTDERLAATLDLNRRTGARGRAPFAAAGRDATLHTQKAKKRPYRPRDGAPAARRLARTATPPPEGQARWTLQLRAAQRVAREGVEASDPAPGGGRCKKDRKPWRKQQGVIPPPASVACVAHREDVRDVYAPPLDEARPGGRGRGRPTVDRRRPRAAAGAAGVAGPAGRCVRTGRPGPPVPGLRGAGGAAVRGRDRAADGGRLRPLLAAAARRVRPRSPADRAGVREPEPTRPGGAGGGVGGGGGVAAGRAIRGAPHASTRLVAERSGACGRGSAGTDVSRTARCCGTR